MPKLSICVLTQNNQEICKRTLTSLLKQNQDQLEIIVADASDNKDILANFTDELNSKSVKYLPVHTTNKTEHWNLAMSATNGEWITFMSDSDYIDPKIVEVIDVLENDNKKVDALGWNKLHYDWPEQRSGIKSTKIQMSAGFFTVSSAQMRKRFLGFEKEGLIPFSVYHGAIKRKLAERIKNRFGGVYFEHAVPSYEFGFKALVEARELAFSERALSIMSHESEELLSEAIDEKDLLAKRSVFYQDLQLEDNIPDFPFKHEWSPRLFAAITLRWLINKYGDDFRAHGIDDDQWRKNYVKCRRHECNQTFSKSEFERLKSLYGEALDSWHDGKYRAMFNPSFSHKLAAQKDLTGCFEKTLFLDKNAFGATTPAEFYTAHECFVAPTKVIGLKIIEFD